MNPIETGHWSVMDAAWNSGRQNMYRHAATLARLHREAEGSGIDRARVRIIKEILEPLGIVRGGGTENAEA